MDEMTSHDLKSHGKVPRRSRINSGVTDSVKIKTRFHDAEFEADGSYNLIREFYEQFVQAVLFASKQEKVESPQAQSFIQRGFDQLFSKESIDSFMESERYIRKIRGQNKREWPQVLLEWDASHSEEKKEEIGKKVD
jgi:hypothetical protein